MLVALGLKAVNRGTSKKRTLNFTRVDSRITKSKRTMGTLDFIFYSYITLTLFSLETPTEAYVLRPSASISVGQTLVSQGGTFELGFFNTSNSNKWYLGIWYKTIPNPKAVWVANRGSPLHDASGVLKVSGSGNIVIVNASENVVWSSSSSTEAENPILEFLDTGNLVLRDEKNGDSESYLWQSFDYPCDTLLPGMTIGWNLMTGTNQNITSWKDFDDPSYGDFSFVLDYTGYLELVVKRGSDKYFRSGPWNGIRSSGAPNLKPNSFFTYGIVDGKEHKYVYFHAANKSVPVKLILTQTSSDFQLQTLKWDDKTNKWEQLLAFPRDNCDRYAQCGTYATCNMASVPACQCLKGFKPISQQNASGSALSQGCEREIPLNCTQGGRFEEYTRVKLPETTYSSVNSSMNLAECRVQCLNNCSCTAYANSNITGGGSGCNMWFRPLVDMRQMIDGGEVLYIRMAGQDSEASSPTKKYLILITSITSVAAVSVLGLGSWCIWKKRNKKGGNKKDDLELPLYHLVTLSAATNNFSKENKLGEGGFGPVYKGKLKGGQEIAVKRLSENSMQGNDEFKNEVLLISKLQHKNLVRLLGYCIQGEEKMLVYEYMQNKSLDSYIFEKTRSKPLDWKSRFQIIDGVARGLLYLHHDSRLRIIHRDLKASNVLLDSEMVPKISDFGLARIFSGDQNEAKTKRVVGTYGYISPEYAVDGHFSVKSDVFSFGVILLEIISGRKNWGFCHPDHGLNLLGHAWRLWSEDKSMELVDESMSDSSLDEDVLRCIHIGLLCVQKGTEQRPTMSSVVSMLSVENIVLPKPQPPGFYIERSIPIIENNNGMCISNDITISRLEAR